MRGGEEGREGGRECDGYCLSPTSLCCHPAPSPYWASSKGRGWPGSSMPLPVRSGATANRRPWKRGPIPTCKNTFAKSFATSAEGTTPGPDNSQLAQIPSSVRAGRRPECCPPAGPDPHQGAPGKHVKVPTATISRCPDPHTSLLRSPAASGRRQAPGMLSASWPRSP